MNGLTATKPTTRIDPRLDPGMIATIPGQQERDVALSFQFKADSSRVFYALSIPEYIEAWLQAPDTEGRVCLQPHRRRDILHRSLSR